MIDLLHLSVYLKEELLQESICVHYHLFYDKTLCQKIFTIIT